MRRKAKNLIFISQINRDGSGITPVPDDYLDCMLNNSLMKDEWFSLRCLSLSYNTFIAHGFNSFVVKLKPENKLINK